LLAYANATETYVSELMPRKARLDLLYVRNHSFLLDLDVLLQTARFYVPPIGNAVLEVEEIIFGPVQRAARKYLPWFIIDWLVGVVGMGAAGVIWRVRAPLQLGLLQSITAALVLAIGFSIGNWISGVHRTAWNYAEAADAVKIVFAACMATVILVTGNKWLLGHQIFPSSLVLLGCMFSLVGFVMLRYRNKLLPNVSNGWGHNMRLGGERDNVLLVGADEWTEFLTRMLRSDVLCKQFNVIGIVDNNPRLRGERIHGITVLGAIRKIPQIVRDYNVKVVVSADFGSDATIKAGIIKACRDCSAKCVFLPDILALMSNEIDSISVQALADADLKTVSSA
jgi:FlaA1/EpsC-like NDP-sugar epimerase